MAKQVLGKRTGYPTKYDPKILVRISRKERRKGYVEMFGVDIWHCYEVSFLNMKGKPEFCMLRIVNDASNPYIWESKSLKLYLFSLNNEQFESFTEVLQVISHDLSELAGGDVKVWRIANFDMLGITLDATECLDHLDVECSKYTVDPLLLTRSVAKKNTTYGYYSDLLRSNCEITNQPDWARVYIRWVARAITILPESLLRYIVSYRNHQEFHEPTCERIYQTLHNAIDPKELLVICQYTRRGGIEINPIRSSKLNFDTHLVRTWQQ